MFSRDDMRSSVAEFLPIYAARPIKVNEGGMGLNHSWATWFLLRTLQPRLVVESGVYRGHSTWLIEQAVPSATVYSLDPDLTNRMYISPRAHYSNTDFSEFDWSTVDTSDAFCFFDDHQNAYKRLVHMSWFGFHRAIFEDNWPVGEGDSYSLRHVRAGAGAPSMQMSRSWTESAWSRFKRRRLERRLWTFGHRQELLVTPNAADRANLERRLVTYFEMPPVQRPAQTMWNTPWTGAYEGPEPLLPDVHLADADLSYSYLAFVELRRAS